MIIRFTLKLDMLLMMTMQTLLEKLKSIYLKGEGLPHDRVVPTVGLNIGRIEDANVKLVFWDLGGQVWLLVL
jgi:ADP-ribosylation factor related protein 1